MTATSIKPFRLSAGFGWWVGGIGIQAHFASPVPQLILRLGIWSAMLTWFPPDWCYLVWTRFMDHRLSVHAGKGAGHIWSPRFRLELTPLTWGIGIFAGRWKGFMFQGAICAGPLSLGVTWQLPRCWQEEADA